MAGNLQNNLKWIFQFFCGSILGLTAEVHFLDMAWDSEFSKMLIFGILYLIIGLT